MRDTEQPHDPTEDPLAHPDEPGAYIGNRPEREAETIPGGVRPGDERIAANSSQSSGRAPEDEADPREAGENR
jgi:hypothetical protein